ncbi:hypothetical protein M501DRAFT_1008407 [Patellaria atrata CBS 101060]|uniref:Pre-mRNA splicing factor CLF1 n=1 Tax=Patellaria atrata CBS 101060 TaxID=1346257 RepID=A0A9P4SHL5_9PEZI|nr:hypothetical protein M501DRAFT_1008407 [Patellaria atrata CBS 101060]
MSSSSPPRPEVELNGHCTIIYNGVLYAYSPDAFQALPLEEGGEWTQKPMGVSVTGGACVKATPQDRRSPAALYIVGGATNSSVTDYPGLQRYVFATEKWETITPVVPVTQNRQNHAAAYLNGSASIFVYAGSQTTGETGPSSQTFVISTLEPYGVEAYSSSAPPTVNPMLLPWDRDSAVMIGGDAGNNFVYTFNPTEGWRNTGVTLAEGIQDQNTVQCTLIRGDDGSKVLESYNMGVSPNVVRRIALLTAGGAPATPGQTVGDSQSRKRKRQLEISNWPSYNDTLAPLTRRSGFSVAQDETGRAVITGGSRSDPLCMFDERNNAWLNATQFFAGERVIVQSEPTSSIGSSNTTPSPTSTPASSTVTPAAPAAGQNRSRMLTVLGATLGAIFGIAAILIILLLLIRCKRERRKRQNGYINEKENNRLSFADIGTDMKSDARGPAPSNNNSHSSLAIISGRVTNGHKRGVGPLGSDASTTNLVPKKKSPLGINDPLEMAQIRDQGGLAVKNKDMLAPPTNTTALPVYSSMVAPPTAAAPTRSRSSGWSRYFTNNEATNLASMPSGRSTYASDRTSNASQSQYSHPPTAVIPPLDLNFAKFDGNRLSRVATGSPTIGHSREDLRSTGLGRASSNASSVSSISRHSKEYSAGHKGESVWSPVGQEAAWESRRPVSSVYTDSNRGSHMHRDTTSSFYLTDTSSSVDPSKSTATSLFAPPMPSDTRDSTATMFPRPPQPTFLQGPPGKGRDIGPQDMSWLNLQESR